MPEPDATRWVVITGASSGIGAELARVFAREGASLVLVARRGDRLAALAAELAGERVRVETMVLDLERPDAPEALMRELAERGITIDTLVNNAGFGLRGHFATLPEADQTEMLALNVVALTRLCRLVLPGLVARGRGGIINVASTAAFQAVPYMATYAATKAFVLSLSEAMHEEVRRAGVVVSALCPGPTATEFTKRADMEKSKLFERPMSAETVARMAVAGYAAKRAIVVTGGANRAGTLAVKWLPRAWVRWVAGRLQG